MTDGLIKRGDLKVFKYVTPATVKELTTRRGQSSALWVEDVEGYRVHDYLDWNPSQAEEERDREATKLRMRAFRGRRAPPVTPNVTPHVTAEVTAHVTPNVPGQGQGKGSGSYVERERERKPNGRSNRPIFSGSRLTVFEFMLDDLAKMLGNYTESFDLHSWFFDLDEQARRAEMVIPQRDGGAWLLAQTLAEAKRRGLSIAISDTKSSGKLTARMADLIASSRRDEG